MKLKFYIEKNPFYLMDYYYCTKENKQKIFNGAIIEEEDNIDKFFIKTSWLKSEVFKIDNRNDYIVNVKNLISKEFYIFILIVFFTLVFLTSYFDTDLLWNLTISFCIIVLSSMIFLYTIGQKYFFKIHISKE